MPISLEETLVQAGFSPIEAAALSHNDHFFSHNSNKDNKAIRERITESAHVYSAEESDIIKAISKFPQFADLDHHRVLHGITQAYGWTKEQAFKAIFIHPQFASYDNHRVLHGITQAYGWTQEQASKAIFIHPQFAGRDHQRVKRQASRLCRLTGTDVSDAPAWIMENPVLAGYSARRYLAVLDVVRQLGKETTLPDLSALVCMWKSNASKSPYVPETKRLRISQAMRKGRYNNAATPPLMAAMRRQLEKRERLLATT